MGPSTLCLLSLLILTVPEQLPRLVIPNFPDLTIKTRSTSGSRYSSEETLYLKGARQRSEHVMQNMASRVDTLTITQCDTKLRFNVNNKEKTYATFPIEDWAERMKRARPTSQEETTGADVTVTIDTVDTGERRKMGTYELHHVKTTTKVEPGPGAVMQPSLTEVDGWYMDLAGLGCYESRSGVTVGYFGGSTGQARPHADQATGYSVSRIRYRRNDPSN